MTGAYVGSSCKSGDLRATLSAAIKGAEIEHGAMLVIRSDNGPQMSSKAFHEYLKELEVKLSHEFIPPATPNKNAHVESFNSILEIELMQTHYFSTLADAYEKVHQFIKFYNERRIHGSINYRTPKEIIQDFKQDKPLFINAVSL